MDLPFETVRRRTQKLLELGLCRKVRGGLIVSAASVEGPEAELALLGNMAGLRRLFRRLESAGFDFSGATSFAAPTPAVAETDTSVSGQDNGA